jgi:hypothetical protein
VDVAGDPAQDFVSELTPTLRPVTERLIAIIRARAPFGVAIKWRQLTFALDHDFDHWVCALAATGRRVNLTFHYGSLLTDHAQVFAPSDAKFVRKVGCDPADGIDDAAVQDSASRSCSTRSATVLRASSSSEATVTRAPLPAPSVMIISAEPASTGSPSSIASVTGTPAFTTASAMIAAGRACRPIAEPTVTVLVGMG